MIVQKQELLIILLSAVCNVIVESCASTLTPFIDLHSTATYLIHLMTA